MKKLLLLSTVLFLTLGVSGENIPFNFNWEFSSDKLTWQPVNLPHDWDAHCVPQKDGITGNGGGFYPAGMGYYRKQFNIAAADLTDKDLTLMLHFEGVYQQCQVFVNGQKAGQHGYGYTPFRVDITPLLTAGNNLVEVTVDNTVQPNCRWYSGSGIYRPVWLEKHREGVMDDATKLFITTTEITGITPDGTHAASATVHITYDGAWVEDRTFNDVSLWSPAHPILSDITVGDITVKYGFRNIAYNAEEGFLLNGQKMLLNGACMHHDDGILGAAAFDAAEIRKVRLMKEAGFNLIRTSHNPTSRAFLDACDSLGMLVIDEAYDGWRKEKNSGDYHLLFDSCYTEDVSALVLRDRNHPSVISWSLGNEVMELRDIAVITTARKIKDVILTHDTTRPITMAIHSWDGEWEIYDPVAEELDIAGYNYHLDKHIGDHQRCPERVIWQTESYPRDAFKNWKTVRTYPYVIGDIVWTGLDYLGESGIGRTYYEGETPGEHYMAEYFPLHGAYCGDVDITGWRKPISHYRSMLWNEDAEPIYMAVKEPDNRHGKIHETWWSVWPMWESWTWEGWEGRDVEVEVYTHQPEVTLTLNGKTVGTKQVDESTGYKAVFTLPYQPGTLTAKAGTYETTLRTAGAPAGVKLTADKNRLKADGQDLAFITLEVVDKDGVLIPEAQLPYDVRVTGAATLQAAASADLTDLEPMSSSHVTTWKGRALIVVRASQKKGTVTVRVPGSRPLHLKVG